MKYELLVTEPADLEITQAYNWYEDKQPGLGESFLRELQNCFAILMDNPRLFQDRFNGIRAAVLKRFPYLVTYQVIDHGIVVMAVFHTSRDPMIWKARKKN